MKKLVAFSLSLLVILSFGSITPAKDAFNEDNIKVEVLTDAEAYNNLVKNYGYSDEDAYSAVYSNKINNLNSSWRSITKYEEHAVIKGQYKQDSNGWITDAAPQLIIQPRHDADEINTIYRNKLRVVDYNELEMDYKFDWTHFVIPDYDEGTYDRTISYHFN